MEDNNENHVISVAAALAGTTALATAACVGAFANCKGIPAHILTGYGIYFFGVSTLTSTGLSIYLLNEKKRLLELKKLNKENTLKRTI